MAYKELPDGPYESNEDDFAACKAECIAKGWPLPGKSGSPYDSPAYVKHQKTLPTTSDLRKRGLLK